MKKALLLVEGNTEERFVKNLLHPHFNKLNLYLQPVLFSTKVVKSGPAFKGGLGSWPKVKKELKNLLSDSSAVVVSTMIDYYGRPKDFPGRASKEQGNNLKSVELFEDAVAKDIDDRRFIPFFTLHEFEGLLFASPDGIAERMNGRKKELNSIRNEFPTPEDINDDPSTCPSKRLKKLFPGYRKPLDGTLIAGKMGLDVIRGQCPHFDHWLKKLEALAD
jgi:hypothetical protein